MGYVSPLTDLLQTPYVCKTDSSVSQSPLNAMAISLIFTVILTCIVIGSSTAYNVFVTLVNSGLLSSYMICIGCKTLLSSRPQT
jgi:amino acid transporter